MEQKRVNSLGYVRPAKYKKHDFLPRLRFEAISNVHPLTETLIENSRDSSALLHESNIIENGVDGLAHTIHEENTISSRQQTSTSSSSHHGECQHTPIDTSAEYIPTTTHPNDNNHTIECGNDASVWNDRNNHCLVEQDGSQHRQQYQSNKGLHDDYVSISHSSFAFEQENHSNNIESMMETEDENNSCDQNVTNGLHDCANNYFDSPVHCEIQQNDSDDDNESTSSGDEQFDNEGDDKPHESSDKPIYRGHTMSVSVSMLLILMYTVTHSVSGTQLQDLLTLISLHCLEQHPGLKSLFHFKKYFSELESPLIKHYYCSRCLTPVKSNQTICTNTFCLYDLTSLKSKSYFLEIPIESQLQNLFSRQSFVKLLKHRFTRFKKQASGIEDIYDGDLYKKLSGSDGPLSSKYPFNLSFTWNTDGVPVFKSSKYSIWPMYLAINELPPKVRRLKENIIFSGLWFGESKPAMLNFTAPLHQSLKRLESSGIEVIINDKAVNVKAFLLCGTADLPAKSLVLNCIQFNGHYGCPKCLQPGKTHTTTKKGHVHIFPYDTENPLGVLRTADESFESAIQAEATGQTVKGIKGPSFLMACKYYDYVKSTSIDYMHMALMGIAKRLHTLWFFHNILQKNIR
ncbi:uncharacterized protein [Ptychodera flava]|uniref:uncharacterized protein n=1 Tax=Ptychodera flava TaxID=63121 RepID=UPI00396A167B